MVQEKSRQPTNPQKKKGPIYLEPKWPLFLKVNTAKQGLNFNQNKGPHLGSRYTLYLRWNPSFGAIYPESIMYKVGPGSSYKWS